MADKKQEYKISIKVGGKLIAGHIENGLSLKANFEEILLKANNGAATDEFIDFDTEISVSGKTYERGAGETATHEDFVTLKSALASGTAVTFVYGEFTAGEGITSGTAVITEFNEKAGASKAAATWDLKLKATKGTVVFGTY